MAVEQDLDGWLFGWIREHRIYTEYTGKFKPTHDEPSISQYFRLHFLHDLESLYWTYLWFLHHRVPVGSTHVDYRLAQGRGGYFHSPLLGERGRLSLFLNTLKSRTIWNYLEPLYTDQKPVIGPVILNSFIVREYRRIQQVEPEEHNGTWRLPVDCFNEELYINFEKAFDIDLDLLGPGGLPVKPAPP